MRCSLLILLLVLSTALAQTVTQRQPKADPSLVRIEDKPGLPRVLIIGDSISIGYTLPVRKLLDGKANVHRIPENGGPTTTGVARIDRWLGDGKWDVIHFNWGLHDIKRDAEGKLQVPPEAYEKNLRELVARLKKTNAKLIWCSTTPVPNAKVSPVRKSEDVVRYNTIAKKIMDENGIAIDDLYTFALPKLTKIQRKANVHFTPEGSDALAEKVVESIRKALPVSK